MQLPLNIHEYERKFNLALYLRTRLMLAFIATAVVLNLFKPGGHYSQRYCLGGGDPPSASEG